MISGYVLIKNTQEFGSVSARLRKRIGVGRRSSYDKNNNGNSINVGLMVHLIDDQEILCHSMRNVYDCGDCCDSARRRTDTLVCYCNADHGRYCLLFGKCERTFSCISAELHGSYLVWKWKQTTLVTGTVILTDSLTQRQTGEVVEKTQVVDKRTRVQ
jgi:hypothetical protein